MIDPAGGDAEHRFLIAGDGVRLHCLHWRSRQSPPSAVLVFLHGIASHAGWFGETAADLNRQGVEVYGLDRRGSGRSGGARGHLDRYEQALDDVQQLVRLVVAEHPAALSGLLLLGPVLIADVKLSPARQVQVLVGHLVAPTTYLPIPLTPELYTANPPYLDFIRADPLRRLEATAQFFWQTARLDRQRRRATARLTLPLLLLQGEADKMIDVPATRRWFARLAVEDKTYRAYAGAGHTLDFEPDRTQYLADLQGWLAARAASASPRPTGGGP